MSRITLNVQVELLSDSIFGSGYSIPGAEDIAVCQDEEGYPYMKGSALKGLLRESLENWLDWTKSDQTLAARLLGEDGWQGIADERRVQLTSLTLTQKPYSSDQCYNTHIFTQVENGVVKSKSLRTAICIRRGYSFSGELYCAEEDETLVQNALGCVKWVGQLRNRGFGRVRIKGIRTDVQEKYFILPETSCIRYRLHTELPVFITDLSRSQQNTYETRGYIPGGAIRGMLIERLVKVAPQWFQENRVALLSDKTRFLSAVPIIEEKAALPSIKGFYEDKDETEFVSVVPHGVFKTGFKRAKIGQFCALDGDTLTFWSAQTNGVMRIQRNVTEDDDTRCFQMRYLEAGQTFEGYIMLDNPALAPMLGKAFSKTVWLGADRYEGFGKCSVNVLEPAEKPAWQTAYGCKKNTENILYLLAVSPFTMLNEIGEPCGINETHLAELLHINQAELLFCSASIAEYGGYNRVWGCREPATTMYEAGSIFKLQCDAPPDIQHIHEIERNGIGIRRAEGYGQILFLSRERFETLCKKKSIDNKKDKANQTKEILTANIRRAQYQWVMEHSDEVYKNGLSKSQVGAIQTLCEKAIAKNGDTKELTIYFDKNIKERGARHGNRFQQIRRLIQTVLSQPLTETLHTETPDTMRERLELLCLLFDHSRKI